MNLVKRLFSPKGPVAKFAALTAVVFLMKAGVQEAQACDCDREIIPLSSFCDPNVYHTDTLDGFIALRSVNDSNQVLSVFEPTENGYELKTTVEGYVVDFGTLNGEPVVVQCGKPIRRGMYPYRSLRDSTQINAGDPVDSLAGTIACPVEVVEYPALPGTAEWIKYVYPEHYLVGIQDDSLPENRRIVVGF